MNSGLRFPGRDDIIFVTAGVIVLTLLVQSPLLPAIVRWARLPEDTTTQAELRLAEHAITTTAVAALPERADVAAPAGGDTVKDCDFRDGHLLRSSPRRLLVIATGNITKADLFALVEDNLERR
jgi:NhaP-type Na+/H+ or K+/H+ antiporter